MGLDLTQTKLKAETYNKVNKAAFDAYKAFVKDQTDDSIWNLDLNYDAESENYEGEDTTTPYKDLFESNNSRVGSYSTLHRDWRDPMLAKFLPKLQAEEVNNDKITAMAMFIQHSDCDGHYTIDQLRYMSEHIQSEFDEQEKELLKDYKTEGESKIYLTNWAQLLRDSHDKECDNTVVIFC